MPTCDPLVSSNLEVPRGHVQRQAVSPHIVHGIVDGYHLAGLIDHHPKLYLVVKIIATNGNLYLFSILNVG